MLKIQTPGAYLVDKDDNRLQLGDRFYEASEIHGFKSAAHKIILTNTKTGEVKTLFPGEFISVEAPKKKRASRKKKVD